MDIVQERSLILDPRQETYRPGGRARTFPCSFRRKRRGRSKLHDVPKTVPDALGSVRVFGFKARELLSHCLFDPLRESCPELISPDEPCVAPYHWHSPSETAERSTFTTRVHRPHESLRVGFLSKQWKTKSIACSPEPKASFVLPTETHALAKPLACLCAGMLSQVSFITSGKKRPRAGREALISR